MQDDMQLACSDRTQESLLTLDRGSALQQIDLKNDVCDERQRSRGTDAAACVRAQVSLLKRYLLLSNCQEVPRKVVPKSLGRWQILRTFCALALLALTKQ